MTRLAMLRGRRAELHREIALARSGAAESAAAIRTDIGAALLGASVARLASHLFARRNGMRGALGLAAGIAAAFAARAIANASLERRNP
jgi:hypothetical protein